MLPVCNSSPSPRSIIFHQLCFAISVKSWSTCIAISQELPCEGDIFRSVGKMVSWRIAKVPARALRPLFRIGFGTCRKDRMKCKGWNWNDQLMTMTYWKCLSFSKAQNTTLVLKKAILGRKSWCECWHQWALGKSQECVYMQERFVRCLRLKGTPVECGLQVPRYRMGWAWQDQWLPIGSHKWRSIQDWQNCAQAFWNGWDSYLGRGTHNFETQIAA